jgi:hypothetical protein
MGKGLKRHKLRRNSQVNSPVNPERETKKMKQYILSLELPAEVLNEPDNIWQGDALMLYNPMMTVPSAYDPQDQSWKTAPFSIVDSVPEDVMSQPCSVNDIGSISESQTQELSIMAPYDTGALPSLPRIAETIDDWPLRSNRLCGHCAHPFHTVPFMLPLGRTGETFDVLQNVHFCSASCTKAFNEQQSYGLHRKTEINMLLCHLVKQLTGANVKQLHSAPSPLLLNSFAGTAGMTIEAYRALSSEPKPSAPVLFPPIRPLSLYFEELK